MKTTKIDRNSWTYKVASFFGSEKHKAEKAKDICSYRWLFIKNLGWMLFIGTFLTALSVSLIVFHYLAFLGIWDPEERPATVILAVGYLIIGVGTIWNIWVDPYLKKRKRRKDEEFTRNAVWNEEKGQFVDKRDEESTLKTMYRSWKDKHCIKVEFEGEEKE